MEKVSILIPTYNQERTIAQAIKGALDQDHKNLEIIVCDDASKDNTVKIVKELIKKHQKDNKISGSSKTIKLFVNKKNIGGIKNHARLLHRYATGRYALTNDGDDYLIDKRYVSDALRLIKKHKLAMVFAKTKLLLESTDEMIEEKVNSNLPEIFDGNWFFLRFYKNHSLPHNTCLFDIRKAKEIGFYKANIQSSDWEALLRLLLGNRIGFIDRFVSVYRKHDKNVSRTRDLSTIKSNVGFIELPYRYAIKNKHLDKRQADRWKEKMLKRYFSKYIVVNMIKKKDNRSILELMKKKYPRTHHALMFDPKIWALHMISQNDLIMRFIFKHILKMEAFYVDIKNEKDSKA